MQRMLIRTLAIFILVLASGAGALIGLGRQQQLRTEAMNRTLVAETFRMHAERQRAGEAERASRTMRRLAESDAKIKADAASRAAAALAKLADANVGADVRPAPKPYDGPIPTSCTQYSGNQAIGCAEMLKFGFPLSEMPCLKSMWMKESGWNVHAMNPSGAYGIPQALPGSKMSSAGPNWQDDAATQIRWGLGYIQSRYQTPCGAWSFWQAHGYY